MVKALAGVIGVNMGSWASLVPSSACEAFITSAASCKAPLKLAKRWRNPERILKEFERRRWGHARAVGGEQVQRIGLSQHADARQERGAIGRLREKGEFQRLDGGLAGKIDREAR